MNDHLLSQKTNGAGHLYSNSIYGHYSQITEHNKTLFPLFKYAKPITILLEKGDSLYIPAKWWHWVKSYGDRCISLNFWFDEKQDEDKNNSVSQNNKSEFAKDDTKFPLVPTKYTGLLNEWGALTKWNDEYLIDKIDKKVIYGLWLWLDQYAVRETITFKEFVTKYKDSKIFAYLVTTKNQQFKNVLSNDSILDVLKDDYKLPFPDMMPNAEANFWMNFGGIDTGLHYDDKAGLLCMVEGRKEIILYSPMDSEYLYPYPLNPIKLKPYFKEFCPNIYQEGQDLPDMKISSAQILEVSLHKAPNVARIARVLQEHYGEGRIVYGIKNKDGIIKWEFYFYGVNKKGGEGQLSTSFYNDELYNPDMKLESHLNLHKKLFPEDHYEVWPSTTPGLFIHSIDLTEESVINGITPQFNLYYTAESKVNIPSILTERTWTKNGQSILRSTTSTEMYKDVMINVNTFRQACMKIGIDDEDTKNMIRFAAGSEYKCYMMSFFNKPTEVGMYFFEISYEPFLEFLSKYYYSVSLIEYVAAHKEDISKLQLEVGFHFTKGSKDSIPSRVGFYGIF